MRQFGERLDPRVEDPDALFEIFATYCVLSQYYSAFESDFDFGELRSGEPRDLGVDGYAVLIGGQLYTDPADVREVVSDSAELDIQFVIVQARRRRTFEGKVFTDVANNLVHILSKQELALNSGPKVRSLHECAHAIYSQAGKFHQFGPPRLSFWYVSLGSLSEAQHQAKIQHARDILKTSGRFREPVEVRGAGAHELRVLHHRASSTESATFEMPHHVRVPDMPGIKRAFFGVLSARTVVDRILKDENGKPRRNLIEDNLRGFLTVSDVNSKIRATLEAEDHRSQFAALNNGVTIVTRDLEFANPTFDIKDPQIVNGWQTCNVIQGVVEASSEPFPDSVMVPVRIIESGDERLIQRIVEATNTQNALTIPPRDDLQLDLEDYFLARNPGPAGLRYERRPRQYGKDVGKSRLVTPRRLAQAYAAMWLDKPHLVSRYALLMQDHGDRIFQVGDDPLLYYTAAIVLNKVAWLMSRPNGVGIPAFYRPAQFHLVTGVKLLFLGEIAPPRSEDAATAACEPIIQFLEDTNYALRLAKTMEQAILDAHNSEVALSDFGDEVRTEQFALRFRRAVLESRQRGALTSTEVVRQGRHRQKESSDV